MHIFIDKYLGGGWSVVALTLIFGLEVWRCVVCGAFCLGSGCWVRGSYY